jgi:RloB-like protein
MPRERKGITRKDSVQNENPKVFFVIATEGTDTEPLYFDLVAEYLEKVDHGLIVKVEPLRRGPLKNGEKDTNSDYRRVLRLLDDYKKTYNLKKGDELWCLIDRDRWPKQNIANAAKLCRQKKYEFCLTSPCFELWLLLHFKNLGAFSEDEQAAILKNAHNGRDHTYISSILSDTMKAEFGQGFHKSFVPQEFVQKIPTAQKRAFDMSLEQRHWTIDDFCTRLHELLSRIFQNGPPDFELPV